MAIYVVKDSVTNTQHSHTKIVDGLYKHILDKSTEYQNNSQWIIVDNEPPEIAEKHITIRFTRRKGLPPYGLNDDEEE